MVFIPERALAVTPHGDDVTLFAGGTIAKWVRTGCEVMVVRVTQDEKDAIDLSPAEAVAVNREQFESAMAALGVARTRHLDYRDCELMDAPYGELREKLIRTVREFRPDVILSFDPGSTDEENPDHWIAARAAADAAWAAAYPNFHPEHRKEGLTPHVVRGCWYFTRHFDVGETAVDIADVLERKITAALKHVNMLKTLLHDQKQRVRRAGLSVPMLDLLSLDNYGPYWAKLIKGAAGLAAQGTEFVAAERFRSTVLDENDMLVQFLIAQSR
ncbi:MAG: PIG-L family deacetylase [Myxococcales bacterium]|nr:MAG: PIG-L family deacetylase [Myxococcales bacterium]